MPSCHTPIGPESPQYASGSASRASTLALFESPRCVIFGDSSPMVRALRLIISGLGWMVIVTTRPDEGQAAVLRYNPSLLVADVPIPHGSCVMWIKEVREDGWSGRAVVVSEPFRDSHMPERLGVDAIIQKPFQYERLKQAIAGKRCQ